MLKTRNSSILHGISDDSYEHRNITHRPGVLSFIEADLLFIVICIGGWMAILAFSQTVSDYVIALWAFYTICLFFHCQYITTQKYHIGYEQLMYQRGLFCMKRDFIEMYRIVDYEESSSFLDILFGLKTVKVFACDRTTPELRIKGVPRGLDMISAIRERVEICRKAHGVYEIANRI